MGFSVSASTAILFTSILLVLSNLYIAWENSYVQVKDAEEYWYDLRISRLSTRLNLTSYSYAIGSNHYNLTLTIENNGNTVNVGYWSGIYDGDYVTLSDVADDDVGFLSPLEYLLPGESISLNITFIGLDNSQHTLWIFIGNGCGLGIKWHYNGSDVLIDTTSWTCPSEVT
ncbi:MAG: flagella [Thermococcus sp.]|nr:flagella [Thermococcus sp.]